MTAKEYLISVKNTSKKILMLKEELAALQAKKENLRSVQISEKIKASPAFIDSLDAILDNEESIIREYKAVQDEWLRCRALLKKLSNTDHSNVLKYYYLLNKKWNVVARKMHYSERRIYKLHGEALNEFRKISGLI